MCVEPKEDTEASCDDSSASALNRLQSAFPHNTQEELEELLMLCNGDVDSVFDMLTSWHAVACYSSVCLFTGLLSCKLELY